MTFLVRCDKCNKISDYYLEYELNIIILDLLLFKELCYKHILFNENYFDPLDR